MTVVDFEATVRSAFERALTYLSYRHRTEQEVRRNLEKRNFSVEVIDAVLVKLQDYRFVDDSRYTDDYIQIKGQGQLKGRRRIRDELLKKGIERELVESGLTAYHQENELNNALKIAQRYVREKRTLPYGQIRGKLSTKLIGKGYDWEIIEKVMLSLDQDEEIQSFLSEASDQVYEKALIIGQKAKTRYEKKSTSYELRMKVFAYLKQQGYDNDLIQKVLAALEVG